LFNKSKKVIFGKKSFEKEKIIFVNERDFQSPPFDYEAIMTSVNEIKKIQKKSIQNNRTIPELFLYEDIAIWWFMYTEVFKRLATITEFIINFSAFVNKVHPTLVEINDDFKWINIIKQICKKNKIRINIVKPEYLKFQIREKLEKILRKQRAKIITKRKIKRRINLFYKKDKSIPNINNKAIFAAGTIFRRQIFNLKTGRVEKGEYILQDIRNLLDDKNIVGIDFFTFVNADDQILNDRLDDTTFQWIPVEVLFSKQKKSNKHEEFIKKYLRIIKSKDFQNLFNFKEINFWKEIEYVFEKISYPYYLEYWMHLIDSLTILFSKQKPKVIFLPIEGGSLALAFITISRKFKVKTIGVQHGWISESHFAYNHENFANEKNPSGFPLPDKLLLFGELTKKLLEKKGYPPQHLAVLGNSVFFNIDKIETLLSASSLRKKYKIGKNQKIIIFVPPGYRDYFFKGSKYLYNEQVWKLLLENFGDNKDYFLILKPHPADKTDVYEKILRDKKTPNAVILQGSIIELIFLSDLVISTLSTSITDALCLKKHVIQVQFENVKFDSPFDNFDAVYVTKLNDLPQSIKKVLTDGNIKNNLQKNSAIFLKQFYNIPIERPNIKLQEILDEIK